MPISDRDLPRLTAHLEKTGGDPAGFVATPKKRRRNEESETQRALIKWWRLTCRDMGVHELCLFSVPNGFNGDARRGSVMKLEGQRKGVPDLFLAHVSITPHPIHPQCHPGLFIELKTPTGRLSPEQEVYHEILRKEGYSVSVCRSFDGAVRAIISYINPQ